MMLAPSLILQKLFSQYLLPLRTLSLFPFGGGICLKSLSLHMLPFVLLGFQKYKF